MLEQIIKDQRAVVDEYHRKYSLSILKKTVKPSSCSMFLSLAKTKAYILECKKKSPSQGLFNPQHSIPKLIETYNPFASAISVLTNAKYFSGSFNDLQTVRALTPLPILCKDFIIDPIQVYLARKYGADAILLMLSVLNDEQYLKLTKIAKSLNLDILTEVHTEHELNRAQSLNANIIGINQRNLNNLSIDRTVIPKLAPKLKQKNTILIAESGIRDHQDIQSLRSYVDGFLIGSLLNKSNDLELTLRNLIFGPIKICGLTNPESAIQAYTHGATFGGLIFVNQSKRKIQCVQAQKIIQAAPNLKYIGVFANDKIENIVQKCKNLNLYAVQCHGQESEQYLSLLRKVLPKSIKIFKAINGNSPIPNELPKNVDKFVVDNQTTEKLGGTNQTFNWDNISSHPLLKHIFIAGGLNPTNIVKAKSIQSFGLDVNSGVESIPGVKSNEKIQMLFQNIRAEKAQRLYHD